MSEKIRRIQCPEDFSVDWPDGYESIALGTEDDALPMIVVLTPFGEDDEANNIADEVIRALGGTSQPQSAELRIVFDGPPGPDAGRFVEVETADGKSVNAGEWHKRDDGLWELRLTAMSRPTPTDSLASNLSRTADALESLIREVSDPGSEALAALHCARAAVRTAMPRPAPEGGEVDGRLTDAALRDYLLRAHGMATGRYVQSDSEMRRRIGVMLEEAVEADDIMRGFLGRGGPEAGRDILSGSGDLSPRATLKDPRHE